MKVGLFPSERGGPDGNGPRYHGGSDHFYGPSRIEGPGYHGLFYKIIKLKYLNKTKIFKGD